MLRNWIGLSSSWRFGYRFDVRLFAWRLRVRVRKAALVPDEPVRDDAAGLRAANARLQAPLAERDAGAAGVHSRGAVSWG